ncbi:hypothetical protein R0135_14260 [Congregibacter variabilis]|uniref:FG-GAP repeat-containing protein n=1 Tax=Congregibacter variabilis TaxID=3081200 RepID=A0ABZ0I291_9GAMM|nr:hypothetical protein R0135_14260 [Congregibacter sp. IMCC43200]
MKSGSWIRSGLLCLAFASVQMNAGPLSAQTLTEFEKLFAPTPYDQQRFGGVVAISGDTMALGVPADNNEWGDQAGSVYIFVRENGGWAQQTKLINPDGAPNEKWGEQVAIHQNTIVVGQSSKNVAYVFERHDSDWDSGTQLKAGDVATLDSFGGSVAVYDDTVIVGARLDDVDVTDQGSVYVYVKGESGWVQQQKIVGVPSTGNTVNFGNSVALFEDTLVVGSYLDGDIRNADGTASGCRFSCGSAYVFNRSDALISPWVQNTRLFADDRQSDDAFGFSVAIFADTILIGARSDRDERNGRPYGSAYVFERSETAWNQVARLTASDRTSRLLFGYSVAATKDTLIVGAPGATTGIYGLNGAAYAFERAESTWRQQFRLLPTDTDSFDLFGVSVAISNSTALAGSPRNDSAGTDSGAAYSFELDAPLVTEIVIGNDPVAVNEWLTLSAAITDADTGRSNIVSAEFEIRGINGVVYSGVGDNNVCYNTESLCPVDEDGHPGFFDSTSEKVEGQLFWESIPDDPGPGLYEMCVRGTDYTGNISRFSCKSFVVYDPSAGFVSGSGSIASPPGADLADATAAGPARFAFISKYLKGRTSPDGNLQFQFHDGDLKFRSTSLEWLVVTGEPRGRFQGNGQLREKNTVMTCTFVVDAWDGTRKGEVDKFGIQIFGCSRPSLAERYKLDAIDLTSGNIIISGR